MPLEHQAMRKTSSFYNYFTTGCQRSWKLTDFGLFRVNFMARKFLGPVNLVMHLFSASSNLMTVLVAKTMM